MVKPPSVTVCLSCRRTGPTGSRRSPAVEARPSPSLPPAPVTPRPPAPKDASACLLSVQFAQPVPRGETALRWPHRPSLSENSEVIKCTQHRLPLSGGRPSGIPTSQHSRTAEGRLVRTRHVRLINILREGISGAELGGRPPRMAHIWGENARHFCPRLEGEALWGRRRVWPQLPSGLPRRRAPHATWSGSCVTETETPK